ncbi:MAG: hypothetical protein BWY84_00450 [Candidatus Aerophobetes bacterium ADurb.Bin490]|nr:MAG: hypothetical protein BWY84_00450 [Candidatus Aerophobetes bacterium ADurb.Bin490]HPN63569.1 hypothetical protein [Candidatus Goldiibacteriota bacterium]HRQ42716.1 hypothetical protein [Candidatus Goldiibacteriota bacterium]
MTLTDGSGRKIQGITAEAIIAVIRQKQAAHENNLREKTKARLYHLYNRDFFRLSDMDALHNKWDNLIAIIMG